MTSSTEREEVIFLPGGYDNQQNLSTPTSSDSVGHAVFSVNAESGAFEGLNKNHGNFSAMTHSIVDLNVVDHDADGINHQLQADGSYLADSKVPNGTWTY